MKLHRAFSTLCLCLVAFAGAGRAEAAPVRTENVETELHSSRARVAPGESFDIVLRQKIREGWHTYWRNPGDSGTATEIAWTLPPGVSAGPIRWPPPQAIPLKPLVNYGYEGEVAFPIRLTLAPDAPPRGTLLLKAKVEWLVCEEICIPEEADLTLPLTLAATGADDPQWSGRVAAAAASVPRRGGVEAQVAPAGEAFVLTVRGLPQGARAPHFFPFAPDAIDHAGDQAPRMRDGAALLRLTPSPSGAWKGEAIAGVVTAEVRENGALVRRGYEIEAVPAAAVQGGPGAGTGEGTMGLGLAAAFAFLGGLILNVMPCVFPVLSIKALSLAGAQAPAAARRQGMFFLAGVMATFLALAGVLLALQAAGAAAGWGFQLQEPLVVWGLALLFFALGLNLLGAFEVGGGLQGVGGGLARLHGAGGSFFTGALAVVAASPCTAPFMGAALGYAATQSAPAALAVFASLGLGFAAPFTALSFAPGLHKRLPKPGPWMERFKQFLAFPMFGAAIWLVWVLAQQAGADGALLALVGCLGLAYAVWSWRTPGRWVGFGLSALALLGAGLALVRAEASPAAPAAQGAVKLEGQAWSPARLAALRAEGRPVFVDFTAAWCITCQVNARVALSLPETKAAFERANAAFLVADWTSRDPVIAAALKEHGRAGVPLYLMYPGGAPDAPPRILPQILTPDIIQRALAAAAAPPAQTEAP